MSLGEKTTRGSSSEADVSVNGFGLPDDAGRRTHPAARRSQHR